MNQNKKHNLLRVSAILFGLLGLGLLVISSIDSYWFEVTITNGTYSFPNRTSLQFSYDVHEGMWWTCDESKLKCVDIDKPMSTRLDVSAEHVTLPDWFLFIRIGIMSGAFITAAAIFGVAITFVPRLQRRHESQLVPAILFLLAAAEVLVPIIVYVINIGDFQHLLYHQIITPATTITWNIGRTFYIGAASIVDCTIAASLTFPIYFAVKKNSARLSVNDPSYMNF